MTTSRTSVLPKARGQQSGDHLDTTLLPWLARGDEEAFRLFFDATNGLLFGLLLRILGHTQIAEEVLSELYEEIRHRASRFGQQNERPLTWLILMAHRRAIEHLCQELTRRRERLDTGTRKTNSNVRASCISITEQRRLVRAVLEAIPPLQHQMIELTFFSGMNSREIAKKLGLTPQAVEDGLRNSILQLFGVFKSIDFKVRSHLTN